jgi:hypothetical protein
MGCLRTAGELLHSIARSSVQFRKCIKHLTTKQRLSILHQHLESTPLCYLCGCCDLRRLYAGASIQGAVQLNAHSASACESISLHCTSA